MKSIRSKILHLMLFIFVIVMFLAAYGFAGRTMLKNDSTILNRGWTIKYNGETFEDVDLTTFKLPITNSGDWIVMTNRIPDKLPKNITMRLHMVFSVTQMFIGGDEYYVYGMEEYKQDKLLGYGTTFITLPDDCPGKDIKIIMSVTENNAFTSIYAPEFYDSDLVYAAYYSERMFPLCVGVTLVIAGMCIAMVTFALYFKSYSMEKLFCIGVFSICIGIWSICNYDLNYLFTPSLKLKTYLEYFSLYLMLFPILLYFREDVEERQKRWESFVFYALLLIEIQLFIIAIVCQAANLIHLPSFLKAFQVLMCAVTLYIGHLTVWDIRKENNHKALSLGIVIMLAIALRDLLAFNYIKYVSADISESEFKSYIAAGVLILVVAMLTDFIHEMRKQMYKSAEIEFLEKIAYVDVLTGLYTRRKCDQIFERINNRHYEFAIIQFDLNNLKNTNDEYGHEAGDELIKRFAEALRYTFDSGETLGRMGGDEFIAMVTDAYDYDIDSKIKKLNEYIANDNLQHEFVKVSVSIGYCKSIELDNPTAQEVYKEADSRMYKEKELYYQKLGYKRRRYDNT